MPIGAGVAKEKSKKVFAPQRARCYTPPALETVLGKRDSRPPSVGAKLVAGSTVAFCNSPSPKKLVSRTVHTVIASLTLILFTGPLVSTARGEIISYRDQTGRLIYVNTEDQELARVAAEGGATAVLHLIEQRKRSMPGILEHIEEVSRQHGVDPALVHAVIEAESAWNPTARSHKGALGLMQLLPATAARFGVRELFNPEENVLAGVRYLRFLLDRFQNNVEFALAAYNAGENAVEAAGGVPPYRETRAYLQRLRTLYGKLGPGAAIRGAGYIYPTLDAHGRVVYVNE